MTAAQLSSTSPATGTSDQPGASSHDRGHDRSAERPADRVTGLDASGRRLAVLEDGAFGEPDEAEVHAGVAQQVELVGVAPPPRRPR